MNPEAPYEKSIQATAETIKELTKAGEKSGAYLTKVFGPSINEAAEWVHEIVQDKRNRWRSMKEWREANLEAILRKLSADAPQNVATVQPLPPRLQLRIINAISNEDNEIIQKYWHKLLLAATNSEIDFDLGKLHLKILENIDEIDVILLDCVADFLIKRHELTLVLLSSSIFDKINIDADTLEAHLEHLSGLGCFRSRDNSVGLLVDYAPYSSIYIKTEYGSYEISSLLTSILKITHDNQSITHAVRRKPE